MKSLITILGSVVLSACSVFGASNVEIAPYQILEKDGDYELRHYDSLTLVTTPMINDDNQREPFKKLFNYISGDNTNGQEISMTAPVFMDKNNQGANTMSFVLPSHFSKNDAPIPQDPSVQLEEIKNYTVATIQFSGTLSQDNIENNKNLLNEWITTKNYSVDGVAKVAGYNPPFTIPAFRRNEILIPVSKASKE